MIFENNQSFKLFNGDSEQILKQLPENSIDSIVTDPPYGLSNHKPSEVIDCLSKWINGEKYEPKGKGFMGQAWDAWVPGPEIWKECLRVLKPGGHMLVFAGTRSMDLMCMAVRLAGFELRDSISYLNDDSGDSAPILNWGYGSGFPKSLDIGKAFDKSNGIERIITAPKQFADGSCSRKTAGNGEMFKICQKSHGISHPVSENAKKWDGWGTALKPAIEPIILCRKPLDGTVIQNVQKWGVGGINIDECRVATTDSTLQPTVNRPLNPSSGWNANSMKNIVGGSLEGRWPANLIHDGSDGIETLFPQGGAHGGNGTFKQHAWFDKKCKSPQSIQRSSQNASRFFYCAKANQKDKTEDIPEHITERHPTVKPHELCKYLIKLVTPTGGTVLDPFMGSGSTGKAAMVEGNKFVGIELDPAYFEIATHRISAKATFNQNFKEND